VTTLSNVLSAYTSYRTPSKSVRERRSDARRAEMWERVLGADLDDLSCLVADARAQEE
jgi:hypothetical protein